MGVLGKVSCGVSGVVCLWFSVRLNLLRVLGMRGCIMLLVGFFWFCFRCIFGLFGSLI